MKLKKKAGQAIRDCKMLGEYLNDYKLYRKYNFGNIGNTDKIALEGKIMRQAHILEKGMSLSNPRVGFGQKKIQQLFEYLDEYIERGFPQDSPTFQSALGSLMAYVIYFKQMNYVNPELENKINSYNMNDEIEKKCGIKNVTWYDIKKSIGGDFEELFSSRYSVRQFSSEPVSTDLVKKAVALATKAPSACNRQSAKVYMTENTEKNREIGKLLEGNHGFDEEVSRYLVITGDLEKFTDGYERNQCIIDASLFAMSLVLALHYYGIGSCILQASERKQLDKKRHLLLDIPENEKIVLFIAIGNYKEQFSVAKSQRNPLSEYLVIK